MKIKLMPTIQKQEGAMFITTVQMELVICCSCAIPFGLPSQKVSELRSSQERFYCPNGHGQSYTRSTEDILRDKLKDLEQTSQAKIREAQKDVEFWNKRWEEQLQEKKKIMAKLNRTEKRISNGVCPCCNRTFQDLAKHMKTKHPEAVNASK